MNPIKNHTATCTFARYYKQALDVNEMKQKREKENVSYRKTKRNKLIQAKRALKISPEEKEELVDPSEMIPKLPQLVQDLSSDDEKAKHKSIVILRKLLSLRFNPPTDAIIEAGAIKPLIHILADRAECNLTRFEAAWALTNVASGSSHHTSILLQCGGAQALFQVLQENSSFSLIKEQAVWAIGNITGDSTESRDFLLQIGTIQPLLKLLDNPTRSSLTRNIFWTIANLCRGRPPTRFEYIAPAVPVLIETLRTTTDLHIKIDICWALSYISDGNNVDIQIDILLRHGICPLLVDLINHPAESVAVPALRILSNIASGTEEQTQLAVDCGCVPALQILLETPSTSGRFNGMKREALLTLSNIAAGSAQAGEILRGSVIETLIFYMKEGDGGLRREAAWTLGNFTSAGTENQVLELVSRGCIPPFCKMLTYSGSAVADVAAEALENILKVGKQLGGPENPFIRLIEESNGIFYLEQITSPVVKQKADRILHEFFSIEEI